MNSTARNVILVLITAILIFIFRRLIGFLIVIGLIALAVLLFYTIMRLKS